MSGRGGTASGTILILEGDGSARWMPRTVCRLLVLERFSRVLLERAAPKEGLD